ncbi:MAG: hypothetical protein OEU80_02660 [Deltaproteobacteria bacterium]|nr:hypothetical protein [Deltaproteobacteria bacterium]MDH3800971.1 hypothetical protein [Deltaproteobacteria bacterium]MDH3926646.1 hypothetical protein [Deltaproteobacteria bacterium]MDH3950269.1 hypothetical protein [Deltaproteobacteria bacterium]MDH3962771.1 hypothetical protein [Deltaproteobacteria bacterium]
MKHLRQKTNGMKRHMLLLPVLLVAVLALIMGAAAPNCWAEDDGDEISFEVADVYAELNNTDGDLGFHALIDGEPWKYLKIEDPRERMILWVSSMGRLRRQGLTELFFESAEPNFEDLAPEQFFRRFPAGKYEIESRTLEGDEQESEDLFWHRMPAPPEGISVSGEAIDLDEVNCDDGPIPMVEPEENGDVIISWDEVKKSHPDIGVPNKKIEVEFYQVVVEEEESGLKLSFDLPPDQLSVTVPGAFIALGEEFKFEILVKEAIGGNQTAVESCFEIE